MAPHSPLFAPDYKDLPYWWEATPRPQLPAGDLPARADVLIVGSGYTGLCAALATARGGRHSVVIDAEDAGWGCSSRNGGQISTSIKPSYDELAALHGAERAFRIAKEGHNALAWIAEFIAAEGIDCRFERVGRFHAAHNPAQYEILARKLARQPKGLEVEAHMVPRAEQHSELGTDAYHGGAVYAQHAALDPGRYHQGLLQRALAAGATVVARCPAADIARDGDGFRVATPRGAIQARNVVIATNGYTGPLTPWHRRRVIPIGSYIIATEPLAPELMARLMPRARVVSDTRKLIYYYRASPDRTRILFGGRVAYKETDPRVSAPRLHAELCNIFPELQGTRISHSWVGFVAYTFDTLPHLGCQDGLHYAMGYCGSGISLASYFGTRIGQQVLGSAEGRTGLDGLTFQTRPLYYGDPWFLAASIIYYRWRDRQNR
jgi:glycine/D-amino acid oxidase-like deaminating enzyme